MCVAGTANATWREQAEEGKATVAGAGRQDPCCGARGGGKAWATEEGLVSAADGPGGPLAAG